MSEKEQGWRKVSEADEAYLVEAKSDEEAARVASPEKQLYGADLLASLASYRQTLHRKRYYEKLSEREPDRRHEIFVNNLNQRAQIVAARLKREFKGSKNAIQQMLLSDEDRPQAVNFLTEIKDILPLVIPPEVNSDDYLDWLERNFASIPDDLYEDMLEVHRQNFETRQEVFKEWAEPTLGELKGILLKAASDGKIPVSAELVQQRLANIEVGLVDFLNAAFYGSDLDYNIDGNQILISDNMMSSSWRGRAAMMWGLLEALAGRTIALKQVSDDLTNVDFMRIGLRVPRAENYKGSRGPRFGWLHAEVGAWLLHDLLSGKITPNHDLLGQLIAKSNGRLNIQMFYEAFFENFAPEKPKGERIPKWQKLYAAINKAFAPGFLVKLDRMMKEDGIAKAMAAVDEF